MGRLDGKVALVTGASRGIGRGIALRLASEGACVAVNYRSDEEGARSTVERIEAAGGSGTLAQGDVADPVAAAEMVAEASKAFGALHILVNNAGISADTL